MACLALCTQDTRTSAGRSSVHIYRNLPSLPCNQVLRSGMQQHHLSMSEPLRGLQDFANISSCSAVIASLCANCRKGMAVAQRW